MILQKAVFTGEPFPPPLAPQQQPMFAGNPETVPPVPEQISKRLFLISAWDFLPDKIVFH
jgi:hypothetical protein